MNSRSHITMPEDVPALVLRPSPECVRSDPVLASLIQVVTGYVSKDVDGYPLNTSQAYLALCLAAEDAGVFPLEYAPNLWIDNDKGTFKVRFNSSSAWRYNRDARRF